MSYRSKRIKLNIELLVMFPFVLAGRIAGFIFPLKTKHQVFLFSPSADIGGSIKVNADIAECIRDKKPLIILSKKPKNSQFRHYFDIEGVRVIDLHRYIDNKWYHFINFFFRGVVATWINQIEKPVVFGGESLFFYKIIPHVKKETHIVELCHLNTWIQYSLAFVKYIDIRIFSTPKIKRDVEGLYKENHLPVHYFDRLHFIDNKIAIPSYKELQQSILQVVYVGRGAPQKRVYLIAEIARRMHEAGKPVHFSFVGDVESIIPGPVQQYCTMHGNIKDPELLDSVYAQSDVLLLTSAYEGLPLAVMEMMARGKVVVSTAVDGIPDYITHKENGLLIRDTDEEKIVTRGIELLDLLINDSNLKLQLGRNSYAYAVKHFSGESFCNSYRSILETSRTSG